MSVSIVTCETFAFIILILINTVYIHIRLYNAIVSQGKGLPDPSAQHDLELTGPELYRRRPVRHVIASSIFRGALRFGAPLGGDLRPQVFRHAIFQIYSLNLNKMIINSC